jgi:hypothetical protein
MEDKTSKILAVTAVAGIFGGIVFGVDRGMYDRYNLGNNNVRIENADHSFFAEVYGGSTFIEYADGTTTNFPRELNLNQTLAVLLNNPEHSKLKLETIE